MSTPSATVVIDARSRNPGCLVQLLWFVFVGFWAGQLWILAAWFFTITVIGIPLAIAMINSVPKIIALRSKPEALAITTAGGVTVFSTTSRPQLNLLIRIAYFVLVGWWASAIWMEIAYGLCVILIGMPLGFWMFDRVPALATLRR
ncbi:MAG TPA: YccF domain-containing protein [Anaerolineae bacterium]|nr:YccF domain-containing protein [Anaerolineae bacterium]